MTGTIAIDTARKSDEARMATAGKTFYLASRLLPSERRAPVMRLYCFCRSVDDLADQPGQPVASRLEELRAVERSLRSGGSAAARLGWDEELATISPVMTPAAAALVRAALADLEQRQPGTVDDLLRYAFGVAGTVGLMMCDLLGADPSGRSAAISLGIAMQLTNIARDVAEDLRNGRIYLPSEWISPAEVRGAIGGETAAAIALNQATRRLLALAERFYAVAFAGMAALPWRTRWSILAAALCYRQIGSEVLADIPASWRRRTVISLPRKLLLVARAAVRLLLPRREGRMSPAFVRELMAPLREELRLGRVGL